MGLNPAGFLVGASTVALLASPAAAQAVVVDATPATPVVGAPLTLTGRGLPPRTAGLARLGPAGGTRFRVDAAGRMRVVLAVPRSTRRGQHRLVVTAGRRRLRAPLTVVATPRPPSTLTLLSGGARLLLRPAAGVPGAPLTLLGRGLRAGELVDARLGGLELGHDAADSRGRFSMAAVVPALAAGTHPLRVRSRRVRVALRFTVGAAPAAALPLPAAPAPAVAAAPAAPPTPAPEAPPLPPPPPPDPGPAPVIAAAGDIACDPLDPNFNGGAGVADFCQQRATSNLLVALNPAAVLGLGDMQYNAGALEAFQAVYDPTWGRLNRSMFPVPGNHEYGRPGAGGFFSYFGARAGTPGLGYYSFDLGGWHIIALNSNCSRVGASCGPGSAQDAFLRADLAAHRTACTLAFFHHPLFTSGQGEEDEPVRPFWDVLYAAGADLVLNGHSHNYERFAPQTPAGAADPARGIREIVVGTGGDDLQPFLPIAAPHSERRSSAAFGVLSLTLRPTGYSWRFRPAAGSTFTDSGSAACH